MDAEKPGDRKSGLKEISGSWVVVLILTTGTGIFFSHVTPLNPLDSRSLVFVAFCWFLVVFGVRRIWSRRRGKRNSTLVGVAVAAIILDNCAKQPIPPSPPPPPPVAAAPAPTPAPPIVTAKPPTTTSRPSASLRPPSTTTPPPSQQQQQQQAPVPPRTGNYRQTGRDWLVANQAEPAGYGLYSYLLFGSKPSDSTRARYLAIIKASLNQVETIGTKLSAQILPAQLNLYLLPLYSEPPSNLTVDDLAAWLLDNYNWSRSEKILAAIPRNAFHGREPNGIYILSVLLKPMAPAQTLRPPFGWQDLSDVQSEIAPSWIQYFLNQSARDDPWQESTGEQLALDMRNYVQEIADQMNVAVPALQTAIQWFKPGS